MRAKGKRVVAFEKVRIVERKKKRSRKKRIKGGRVTSPSMANISCYTADPGRGRSAIKRSGRPTYPLNSKNYPGARMLPSHHRNSLSLRKNSTNDTGYTAFLSFSVSLRSPISSSPYFRGRARLSLCNEYRFTLRITPSARYTERWDVRRDETTQIRIHMSDSSHKTCAIIINLAGFTIHRSPRQINLMYLTYSDIG